MQRRLAQGFTLVELVIVIILLAIVATISVQFVAFSTQGALDVGSRQQRALAGAVVSEQISRALRQALPNSVRVLDGGRCVEWFPIRAASTYIDLPLAAPATSFQVIPLRDGANVNGRIAVYAFRGTAYDLSSGVISPGADLAANTVSFTGGASHQFPSASPESRFFVVGDPVSFCQVGDKLRRYTNYGIHAATAQSDLDGAGSNGVLVANLKVGTLAFKVTEAALDRNAVVSFAFELESPQSDETLQIDQEVQIRNVP